MPTTSGYGLVRGDALHIPLRDESVDALITSPPYFALRSYQDDGTHYAGQIGSEPTPADFLAALWAVMDECWRVLKPTGSAWINLGDKYANDAKWGGASNAKQAASDAPTIGYRQRGTSDVRAKSLMGLPWRFALGLTCPETYRPFAHTHTAPHPQWVLRSEVIWDKPNGLPESVTDRVRRSHEQFFHLTKQGRYYAAVDEVREPQKYLDHPQIGSTFNRTKEPNQEADGEASWRSSGLHAAQSPRTINPLGKLPGSVWRIPSEPLRVPDHIGVDHFAAFPQELVRRIILGWTPNGNCTACGEGRRPVVDKTRATSPGRGPDTIRGINDRTVTPVNGGNDFSSRADTEATITGYACACDVTLAPTTPAVVLDPFVGTGTVPMVARSLGRHGIGIDLSRDYLRLAHWRITRSGHGTKSINRTNRERQGQLW